MRCPRCNGSGYFGTDPYDGSKNICDLCSGWGKVNSEGREWRKCHRCDGTGKREESYEIRRTGARVEYGTKKVKCSSCKGSGGDYINLYSPREGHSSCYITTATLNYLGKDDNCRELTLFRHFRDAQLQEEDIAEYYRVAPIVVAKINGNEDKEIIYEQIWLKYLKHCVGYLENSDYKMVFKIYREMFLELKNKYYSAD